MICLLMLLADRKQEESSIRSVLLCTHDSVLNQIQQSHQIMKPELSS